MSVIQFEEIEKKVDNENKKESNFVNLILEIAKLHKQLSEKENHSFYWKKAEPSYRKELQKLENEFNKIKDFVNNNSSDYFIKKLSDVKEEYNGLRNTKPRNSFFMYRLKSLEKKIEYIENILELKQKFGKLLDLEEYLGSKEKLIKLIS